MIDLTPSGEDQQMKAARAKFPALWKHAATVCLLCRRSIEKHDRVRRNEYYLEDKKVPVTVHDDCREVRDRVAMAPAEVLTHVKASILKERTMSETTETTETETVDTPKTSKKAKRGKGSKASASKKAKKASKKGKTSKAAKEPKAKKAKKAKAEGGRARSLRRSVGTALSALLKGNKKVGKIVKALAADEEVSRTDLVTLKDEVNAQAAKARDAKENSLASQLSSANRLVRRLERAARS